MSGSNEAKEALPSVADVKGDVGTSPQESAEAEKSFTRKTTKRSFEAEAEYLHLLGLRSHYGHKNGWSWLLGGMTAFMIVFQAILLGMVGSGRWDFSEYEWLLPALLVQNLGQVIALATIVVRNLFPNQTD